MDQKWMKLPRYSDEYKSALSVFLDNYFAKHAVGNQVSCPCKECKRCYWHNKKAVYDHLVVKGFMKGFQQWVLQREEMLNIREDGNGGARIHDDIDGLLHDTFRDTIERVDVHEGVRDEPNEDAKKFFRLVEERKEEIYPGYKSFSKLSFLIRLFLFKSLNGLSNVAFNDLLELLREAFPDAKFPKSFNEAKNTVKDLGLDCVKIHACPNDCILCWKEHERKDFCDECKVSRWKSENVPAKVLRYFPLKPRLQRLFMCAQTARLMSWHHEERPKDGKIRHPADGIAWKDFDSLYRFFGEDPRNVRLGLASDGFNPFKTMSVSHSTWPVVLINYNLPPWLSMKPEYFMLTLLIPGPTSPGNDIDVYLRPLVDELKDLWENGLVTYDAFAKKSFTVHAALMGTISDFPAYSMLSGWATKGRRACPCCNYDTCSQYLKHSRKTCYMGHRRFLDMEHPWRVEEKSFNSGKEERPAPRILSGTEVLGQLSNVQNDFGKTKKKKGGDGDGAWKKKSLFFELPYWEHNKSRHNLDVMHIEKNVFDNVIGTLLDIPGKTKDHAKARLDLINLGIKEHLQPTIGEDGGHIVIPPASFTMTNSQKDLFLKVLKDAKLPYGYASNIARCVQVRERRFAGYKSHDCHVVLHHLLQVPVRNSLPKDVARALTKYIIPSTTKKYVLGTINDVWKLFKSRIKHDHYSKYNTFSERWKHRPERIPESHFKICCRYWDTEYAKEMSQKNAANRELQDIMHTAGPKSFARIFEKLTSENGEPPSKRKMFEETRKRTAGRKYKKPYDDTQEKIEKMKQIEVLQEAGLESDNDAYDEVMNKEYPGRLRLFGRGVTRKSLKEMQDGTSPVVLPNQIIESIKNAASDLDAQKESLQAERAQMQAEQEQMQAEREKMQAEREKLSKEMEAFMELKNMLQAQFGG